MKFRLLFICFLILGLQNVDAQIGRLALSPFQTIQQTLAKTEISITYCRPAMRGRAIFGDLVPYDQVWRTGANKNTKVTFDKDVMIGDTKLKSGTYSLFTKPGLKNWEVYFYEYKDMYGLPEKWESANIHAQITVPSHTLTNALQSFTITLDDLTNEQFFLSIAWDKTRISIPIKLTTIDEVSEIITDVLDGPDEDDYFLAAQFNMEAGHNLEQAVEWISKAIEMRKEAAWWDYRIKALSLSGLGRKKEAVDFAQQGLDIAQKENHAYGTRTLKSTLLHCQSK